MEKQQELISLYDYLGYAAGSTLGKQVAEAAVRAKQPIGQRQVTNTRYKGIVHLYRREFLEEYFLTKQRSSDVNPSVGDRQDYNV